MSHLSPYTRRLSEASVASGTTYHSFSRAELHRPVLQCNSRKEPDPLPVSHTMRRQDSGYESMSPASTRSQASSRRKSSISVASYGSRTRHRPCMHRASKSGPVAYIPRDSPHKLRTGTHCQGYRQRAVDISAAARHGLPLEDDADENTAASVAATYVADPSHALDEASPPSGTVTYAPPPQTTHYWTSDRTRRLEYAAIDAASRGVRGWVMRHMVPDCFIPEDSRLVCFDDDRGSVVRYRLELDEDDTQSHGARSPRKWKSWLFSSNPR